jgi:hypothetical protein
MVLLSLVLFKSPCKPFTFLIGVPSNGLWRIGQNECEYDGKADGRYALNQKELLISLN